MMKELRKDSSNISVSIEKKIYITSLEQHEED